MRWTFSFLEFSMIDLWCTWRGFCFPATHAGGVPCPPPATRTTVCILTAPETFSPFNTLVIAVLVLVWSPLCWVNLRNSPPPGHAHDLIWSALGSRRRNRLLGAFKSRPFLALRATAAGRSMGHLPSHPTTLKQYDDSLRNISQLYISTFVVHWLKKDKFPNNGFF
jgi:hypothetical protein